IIAHGMGQQVPYETQNAIAQGLLDADATGTNTTARVKNIASGCERLQRLELELELEGTRRTVHVYEAYWAPLTEGVVGILDVLRFLFMAGVNGIQHATTKFIRWMFGRQREFDTKRADIVYLLTAMAVVFSLIVMNSVIAAVAAARFALQRQEWLTLHLLNDLTTIFEYVLFAAALFLIPLAVSMFIRGSRRVLRWPLVALFILLLLTIIGAGLVCLPAALFCHSFGDRREELFRLLPWVALSLRLFGLFVVGAAIVLGSLRIAQVLFGGWKVKKDWGGRLIFLLGILVFGSVAAALVGYLWHCATAAPAAAQTGWAWMVVFGLLAAVSAFARSFLIQFLGDVAAYVQPHKIDRFFDLRNRVRTTVRKTVRAVYALRDDQGFVYDEVFVAGHSLGSVIVYDTLNRLAVEDDLAGVEQDETTTRCCDDAPVQSLDVLGRTKFLLTFGSPVDKIAFIFHVQSGGGEAREALASSMQPLITSSRRPPWVNVWSRQDIISGPLNFFDPPAGDLPQTDPPLPTAVENRLDPNASTLLAAHTQYWQNPLIFTLLRDAILKRGISG
ncbi:MAG TPA: hypothetical protein VF911_21505, partial [Thermoanaerobaculia bacterium]